MGAKGVAGASQFKSVSSFGTTQQQIFSDIGYFRGVLVALKHIRKEHIQLSRNVLLEFNEVGPVLCQRTFHSSRRRLVKIVYHWGWGRLGLWLLSWLYD